MTTVQAEKWKRILAGAREVASDDDMDVFEKEPEANRLASVPNPNQCGILDRWVAYIKGGN